MTKVYIAIRAFQNGDGTQELTAEQIAAIEHHIATEGNFGATGTRMACVNLTRDFTDPLIQLDGAGVTKNLYDVVVGMANLANPVEPARVPNGLPEDPAAI